MLIVLEEEIVNEKSRNGMNRSLTINYLDKVNQKSDRLLSEIDSTSNINHRPAIPFPKDPSTILKFKMNSPFQNFSQNLQIYKSSSPSPFQYEVKQLTSKARKFN